MTWSPRSLSAGSLVHAVAGHHPERYDRALCGLRPAYSHAGWQPGETVTCPRCLRAIAVDAVQARWPGAQVVKETPTS